MSHDPSQPLPSLPALGSEDARALRRLSAVVRLLETLKEDELAQEVCRETVRLTGADYALLFLSPHGRRRPELRGSTLPEEHRVRRAMAAAALQGDG